MLGAQAGHDGAHLLGTFGAGVGQRDRAVAVVAELVVERLHGVDQVHAAALVVTRHFADEHGGHHGVLVAHIGAAQVAVALLEAEEEPALLALLLQAGDLLADVLEAGKRAAQLKAVLAGQGVKHRRAHDGGDHELVRDVLAAGRGAAGEPVGEKHAHLVAAQQDILALVGHGDARAVGVGVGGQQQVGMHLGAQLQALLQRLPDLGVGVGAGGEVTVGLGLLGHHGHVGHPDALEDLRDALKTCAVERGVHDLEVGAVGGRLHMLGLLGHGVHKALDGALADVVDQARVHGLVKGHARHAVEDVDLADGGEDVLGSLRGDLAAVGAVHLVAVVLGGVVACGDVDAGRAPQVARGEGAGGRGLQARVEVSCDAVGRQHLGGYMAEKLALVARVAADGNAGLVEVRLEVVGQALRGECDRVDVHAVRAGAENAAQACRAELEVLEECVLNGLLVALHGGELLGKLGVGDPLRPAGVLTHRALVHAVCSFLLSQPPWRQVLTAPMVPRAQAKAPHGKAYACKPYLVPKSLRGRHEIVGICACHII